ncbi:CsgG/HfaB family protein [Sphingomonas sp. 10B4]|uniref:CsgG/HfaB family protein n=1 Tax=Sphingomonas sp. 10B4 TaxID=3048575 RepID=UPI002AB5409A|nr:CsgG/HfaB family protein [Sphingomonas sp. 10B4]MDY7522688.1 CsgG/HfaB family protein [Sphingomonas sp. 10B4]MEB0283551.1 CsgG/HfaB family protein [Sphingomonas sp. 10B4]
MNIAAKRLQALALLATASALGACTTMAPPPPQYVTPLSGAQVIDDDTAYSPLLRCLAATSANSVRPRIAVGEVADYTGRLDGLNGTVAPQGAALMVMSAISKAGFPLAERLDLRIARQELDYANSKLLGPDGKPTDAYRRIYSGSIAEADMIVLGGITELDFNIQSDVAEISIGPVGGGARSYVMSVGVDLRLIDARSLRVIKVISLQKQIRGRELRAGIFEFIGNTTLDLGVGRRRQEPVHGAIRAIIEKAVIDLIAGQRGANAPECPSNVPTVSYIAGSRPQQGVSTGEKK